MVRGGVASTGGEVVVSMEEWVVALSYGVGSMVGRRGMIPFACLWEEGLGVVLGFGGG